MMVMMVMQKWFPFFRDLRNESKYAELKDRLDQSSRLGEQGSRILSVKTERRNCLERPWR